VPRPISWLPRLAEIRRSVKNSVRSHYERKDIERLFELQPRAAQGLMQGISPAAKVGRSYLLAHSDLARFLDQVHEGADPASLLAPRSAPAPRRRLRELLQVDHLPATLDTAPGNVSFAPGQLTISFGSMEELAGAMLALAEILDSPQQFAAVEQRYVPFPAEAEHGEKHPEDMEKLFVELQRLEQEKYL
jgi:hypothetical protein